MALVEELGIDLGTVNVLVYVRGRGIVLQEPSVVAEEVDTGIVIAVGEEARAMMGRAPERIQVRRPLRDGVIAHYRVTKEMLAHFIDRAIGKTRLFKPRVMITVPFGVTQVESKAVREAAFEAGAGRAHLIPEPLAGAIGAGLPIHTPGGHMVIDLGGGASEAAVLSVYGVVTSAAVRVAGVRMDEAIAAFVRRKYNLMVGLPSAEEAKIRIGAALPLEGEPLRTEIQGRDQVSGLPRSVEINSDDIIEALEEPLTIIVGMVKSVLERTPPELASDIIDRGMTMIGGGSLLRNIDQLLTQETGVPVYVADAPMACVAVGAGKALARLPTLQRTLGEM
ncbi:MAG: rod shape-determining protein [Anaerolineae bacterium]|nr:rod shape-determining protein [Anaerolineae bacterium]